MADNSINWPKFDRDSIQGDAVIGLLTEYACSKGITLRGFYCSDVDVSLIEEAIDSLVVIAEKYPYASKEPLTLFLDRQMPSTDFAYISKRHPYMIHLNVNAYRCREALSSEYANLASEGWFVRGTNYRHIIFHEYGHILSHPYRIDDRVLAESLLNMTREQADVHLMSILSGYAVSRQKGEIYAEIISASMLESPPSFALLFIAEYNKIIAGG